MSKTDASRPRFLVIGMGFIAAAAALTLSIPAAAWSFSQRTPEQRAMVRSLAQACRGDLRGFCLEVRPGDGRILRCLDQHTGDLSPGCQSALPKARAFRFRQIPDDD